MGAQHNTMRRIARLDRSIDLLRARATVQAPSTYLCSACKHHASPFSTSALRAASNGKVPLTEKLRRKIWGTDNPPGLEDPYGDRSVFDQSKKKERRLEKEERDAARLEAQSAAEIENYTGSSRYEPASTWDGLERVGWTEDRWDPENLYTPFVPMEVKTDSEEITAALHGAMVEGFALREAGVPLGSLSKDTPGQDMTLDVTFDQSPSGPVLKFMDAAPPLDDIVQSLTQAGDETAQHDNPTESEEDVAADRSTVDPLHPDAEPTADDTLEKGNPTESEADVDADRSSEDPLHQANSMEVTYEELIASWVDGRLSRRSLKRRGYLSQDMSRGGLSFEFCRVFVGYWLCEAARMKAPVYYMCYNLKHMTAVSTPSAVIRSHVLLATYFSFDL